MVGAALLAKKAVERGLLAKPWVKTSLAPGSKVVMDYYEKAGLVPYLDKLGFHLVGYGCTTCIGNSGPLIEEVSAAVNAADLAVVSVLSGNRNFEGRINPDVKMNYLASPPLCVAYAIAGTMDLDLVREPLGTDPSGQPVYLHDIWPSPQEVQSVIDSAISSEMFGKDYSDVFAGDRALAVAADAHRRDVHLGRRLDVRAQASVLRGHGRVTGSGHRRQPAPGYWPSSATRSPPTTSRRPAPSRRTPPRVVTSPSTAWIRRTSTRTVPGAATTRS